MNTLTLATEAEIKKLFIKSKSISSDLDPFPTSLLKDCLDVLIEPITSIINKSLQEGVFPDQFKKAYIRPLLKKTTLDKNELKNFRSVSNLSFILKILEKVVTSRLLSHMESNSMSNNLQSAYKKFHFTESALLKVENDVLLNMEKGRVTALTLLDLSAVFDTIDHLTLISRLSSWYRISGTALDWFTLYLSNRCQQVKIHDYISEAVYISFGVPQGSVLGPILFTIYTAPLSHVIAEHDVEHHLYADDTQIYISLSDSEASESLTDLKSCGTDVFTWMTNSKLKLNPSKTAFIIIGSKKQREKFKDLFSILLLDHDTLSKAFVRNLGFIFDCDFKFKQQISQTCKICFYHICDFRRIRKYLSPEAAKSVACALVTSHLDYCNSLLYNLPDRDIERLQRVQNCLARVVCKASRFSRSKPLLNFLHWLPVKYHIRFKLCTITFKAFLSHQPTYLFNYLVPLQNSRLLRSSNTNMLTVPHFRTKWGSRAFAVAAPSTWNSLPDTASTVTSLKKMLKTFLFDSASPPLIPRRFGAQLTTYALTHDIELVSIWILCLWARISEDSGAIEVTELNWKIIN